MNVLFITKANVTSINERGIYADLLREFVKNGHNVCIVTPNERRNGENTKLVKEDGCSILRVKTLNLQKVNLIEKGIATLRLEKQYVKAIKKYFADVKFDLVLYSTPPVTFAKVVQFVKLRDNAKCYLLLKDIFPQNAIDLGILKKKGLKGLIYSIFKKKEKKLLELSDYVGCMSPENCRYVISNYPYVNPEKVHVSPNSIEYKELVLTPEEKIGIRKEYELPLDKKIFVFGGNLGRPQGIEFFLQAIKESKDIEDVFFLIVGAGTEYGRIKKFIKDNDVKNAKLIDYVQKEVYERMICAFDAGIIVLHYDFTIPNFPSRALSYMSAGLPIFACTDRATDMGEIITQNGFGWWCPSNDLPRFVETLKEALNSPAEKMGELGRQYLKENYLVENSYKIITDKLK